jgi:DNA-binding GntR family transcriptional regulator
MASRQKDKSSARLKAYQTAFATISGMAIAEDGFIREEDVVAKSGVSRTPVREALHRLQAEGLVRLVPHKGAYVRAMTPSEVGDLLGCRNLFESMAATALIEDERTDILASLQELFAKQLKAGQGKAPQSLLIELDQEFHMCLVRAARNELISEMYQSLRNREVRLMLTSISRSGPSRWSEAIEEHRRILDALVARDLKSAHAAIKDHCTATWKAAIGGKMAGDKLHSSAVLGRFSYV